MTYYVIGMVTQKKQIAKEGELRFAAEFIRKGWSIFLPYGEDSAIDLLIEKEGKYQRVQIKTTKPINNVIHCRIKSSNNWQVKKYNKEDIDYFGIYDYENKRGYLIPIEEVAGMTDVSLRIGKTKNNQKKGTRSAEEYFYF
jgi:hypothetical protein